MNNRMAKRLRKEVLDRTVGLEPVKYGRHKVTGAIHLMSGCSRYFHKGMKKGYKRAKKNATVY